VNDIGKEDDINAGDAMDDVEAPPRNGPPRAGDRGTGNCP
jgi:hypothetical protein